MVFLAKIGLFSRLTGQICPIFFKGFVVTFKGFAETGKGLTVNFKDHVAIGKGRGSIFKGFVVIFKGFDETGKGLAVNFKGRVATGKDRRPTFKENREVGTLQPGVSGLI